MLFESSQSTFANHLKITQSSMKLCRVNGMFCVESYHRWLHIVQEHNTSKNLNVPLVASSLIPARSCKQFLAL
jgi:hypothetical protein